jgi:hypothetical protein
LEKAGNGKEHRDPPLGVRKLVCFGKETWIRIKEVLKEGFLTRGKGNKKEKGKDEKRKNKRRGKKISGGNNKECEACPQGIEISQPERERQIYFSSDDIRISPRGEKERWAGVTDMENPFGDLTKEDKLKVVELLKGK